MNTSIHLRRRNQATLLMVAYGVFLALSAIALSFLPFTGSNAESGYRIAFQIVAVALSIPVILFYTRQDSRLRKYYTNLGFVTAGYKVKGSEVCIAHPKYPAMKFFRDMPPYQLVGIELETQRQLPKVIVLDRTAVPKDMDQWESQNRDLFAEIPKEKWPYYGLSADKAQLESVDFHKKFYVFAPNKLDAFHVLDTDTMADLLDAQSKFGGPLYLFIDQHTVRVATKMSVYEQRITDTYSEFDFINEMRAIFNTLDNSVRLEK